MSFLAGVLNSLAIKKAYYNNFNIFMCYLIVRNLYVKNFVFDPKTLVETIHLNCMIRRNIALPINMYL